MKFTLLSLLLVLLFGTAEAQQQQQQQQRQQQEVVGGQKHNVDPANGKWKMGNDEPMCVSPTNTFTARINLFAGELGYYVIEECGLDVLNPTLAMEVGETYTFVQKDRTNWYHPLGFAYSPYGDEDLKVEVEPGISKGQSDECIAQHSCPAPMYFLNDEYLGVYSNIPQVKNVTTGEDDFGLDVYEPLFFRSTHEWAQLGTFSVKLRFDDDTVKSDLFYFCHIHEFMGGRIKFTRNGQVLNELDTPDLGYKYDVPSDFDRSCGTYGLEPFELPNPVCPDRFVCTSPDASQELRDFSRCIDAMNCHMMSGMTTGINKAQSEAALFVHQMIPHHQNAVNMAKTLMKTGTLNCPDLADDENPDCVLEGILYDIVNSQNLQIQAMYDYLDAKRYPEQDNCDVYVDTVPDDVVIQRLNNPASGSSSNTKSFIGRTSLSLLIGVVCGFVGTVLLS